MIAGMNQLTSQALNARVSRRSLLKGVFAASAGAIALTTLGGAAFTPGSSAAAAAAAGPLDSDIDILNYALTLEHLENAAYQAVLGMSMLSGRALTYFQAFGAHEAAHVDAIVATIQKLGGTPVAPARYDFSSVPMDPAGAVKFFQNVEAVGASAYLGAAGSIQNFDVLEAALSIHAVEAEHAAALADLVAPGTDLFAPEAFATPRTPDEVLAIVGPFFKTAAAPAPAPAPMPTLPNTGGGYGATARSGNGILVP